jgi:hypothetical protein
LPLHTWIIHEDEDRSQEYLSPRSRLYKPVELGHLLGLSLNKV